MVIVLGLGCSKRKQKRPPPMEGANSLEIVTSSISVKAGPVGVGKDEKPATYALVDVRNAGDHDLRVSLGGALVDGAGNELSSVRPEVLVVPGHGLRTFALVAKPVRKLDGVATVKPVVTRSEVSDHPPTVTIEDGQVYDDRGRVVASGRAFNHREARARVVVIGGFYDANEKPMARSFSVLEIDGGQSHPVQFVGPEGSKRAYIFTGDVTY